ncbi:hypothetical protein RBSWK_03167 [Rhodopirellula baltica SWK14]|uniref:Uncharacterized protein n=1 Tax=Rhodopirellula baltica SWK14 TaxID=993516 RepID=L7CF70_RHOBT|nr:hypothetical protein RBSWK_03167 [Rhodopirellula baltica SWK14]
MRITRSAREIFHCQNARLADSGASDGSPLFVAEMSQFLGSTLDKSWQTHER